MADSTIPPSSGSGSFFENLLPGAEEIGFLKKAIECGMNPTACALRCMESFAKYAVYNGPKAAVEFSFWGTKKLFNFTSKRLPTPPAIVTEIFREVVGQVKELAHYPTSWITGKTVEELKQIYLKEAEEAAAKIAGTPSFRAVDLIGPLFLNNFCIRQAWNSLDDTLHSAKALLRGASVIKTAHVTLSIESNQNLIQANSLQFSTTPGLIKDFIVGTILTGLWSTGAYYTGEAILDKLKEAAKETPNPDSRPEIAMVAIAIGYFAIPALLSKIGEFMNTPPNKNNNIAKTSLESPLTAPHLAYIHSLNNVSEDDSGIIRYPSISSDDLTLEQQFQKFKGYRTEESNSSEVGG